MSVDARKLHAKLLRAEKTAIAESENFRKGKALTYGGVAAIAAGVTASATQAAETLGSDAPVEWAAKLQSVVEAAHETPAHMLGAVYETLVNGHAALEGVAIDAGARLLPMVNGVPKRQVELVWTNLGLF